MSSGGVNSTADSYLATFVFRASRDASGTFTVSAVPGDGVTGTLAGDSAGEAMTLNIVQDARVRIQSWYEESRQPERGRARVGDRWHSFAGGVACFADRSLTVAVLLIGGNRRRSTSSRSAAVQCGVVGALRNSALVGDRIVTPGRCGDLGHPA
jgi:hypothetical protein